MKSRLARRLRLVVAVCLFVVANRASAQNPFVKKGDVIVMMGDSITEQRLYSNYVETWCQTRFPDFKLVFRNVGIGGDRSTGGNARFKRDVLPYKPTLLTVDFGMNDGGYQAFNPKTFDVYMKGLQGIADQAKAAGIEVAWITPQPIERREPGDQLAGYNETLKKYSEGVAEISKRNNARFADQFTPYLDIMSKARKTDPKILVMGGDAVHPGPTGQAVMAAAILKGLGFPREVSLAALDVSGKVELTNAAITDVKYDQAQGKLSFKRLDPRLPFFPEQARPILKWAPLLEEMNDYGLKVTGLPAGKYEVRLGGKKAAEYTADQLSKGVNLADAVLTVGPVADQVKEVVKAVADKTNYFHGQVFRGLILANLAKSPDFKNVEPGEFEKRRGELVAERMKKMPELDAAIHQAVMPRAYAIDIVAVK